MTVPLEEVTSKVEAGEALSDPDVEALGASRDIVALGMLASIVRRRLHGTDVTYLRVADLTLESVSLAASGASPAWSAIDQAGELRIFQTPPTLSAAVDLATRAREIAGTTPLSAFCLFELSKLREGLPVVLAALRKTGLEFIAHAPLDRLREPERTIESVTDAGLQLSRLTIEESPGREWTSVCRDVAALQTKLGSIRVFAPLARRIDETEPTTGYEDVRRIALSRLLVGNVATIQVDWALYGPKLAQVALTFGADDIDSVAAQDDLSQGRRRSPVEDVRRGIRSAGFEPVERDAAFKRRG